MQIKDLFVKDLNRPINGVIKVNEQAAAAVWQELDEYVVTKELLRHFDTFCTAYLQAIDEPRAGHLRDRIGVWVSGFFGSGKSHFIKILSYLLQNKAVADPVSGELRRAIAFFEDKINDPLLLNELRRAVGQDTDVLLFNIESKADSGDGRDAILRVFMRVLNELQGFSADHPHIAEMELQLSKEGKLEAFTAAFAQNFGSRWQDERDSYHFRRDEVVAALASALAMTTESAEKWFDRAEETYSLSVEKFAHRVKEYLERQGGNRRIIFVADEVGQFIGSDTHLMLNLQTITENLGTICGGRAWVVVTSQEDIDAVLGSVTAAKANDFSKIQGRFTTRLSLSSSNTDEVIQARLLEKTGSAQLELKQLYRAKGDILRHQLSFSNNGATLRNFRDEDDFVKNYPFAPYHYQLVQSIFESVRKAGATGMHLSRGERSLLDAFQWAAKSIAGRELGALVPLYAFYEPIESFLDTAVKLTINQAAANEGLQPFDVQILKLLFLIRYVEIVKPNLDNLVTLCIDEADTDRLALRQKIEAGLERLERQTLINRNGDLFYFLTNEERDISREIKSLDVTAHEMTRKISDLLFEDILRDAAKHRYPANKKDFGFNRVCDGVYQGNRQEDNLTLEVITPLYDDYRLFNAAKATLYSADEGGRVVIKLADGLALGQELRVWLQTDKYVRQKTDSSLPTATARILRDRAEENRERLQRLTSSARQLLDEGEFYVAGQNLSAQRAHRVTVAEAQSYLIQNLFTKLNYLTKLHAEPLGEIKATLLANDVGQHSLGLQLEETNGAALAEVREYIALRVDQSLLVSLENVVQRFSGRPYGWPEWEVVLLVARLFAAGELKAKIEGATVEPRGAIESFTKTGRWKLVTLLRRKTTGAQELAAARRLAQELFGKLGPETEDGLSAFIREHLSGWQSDVERHLALAETGRYPGQRELTACQESLRALLALRDAFDFLAAFNAQADDLREVAEDYHRLHGFYTTQRPVWERLQRFLQGPLQDNRPLLETDAAAQPALARLDFIRNAPAPYGLLPETDALIAQVEAVNNRLVAAKKAEAEASLETKIQQIKTQLDDTKASADTRNQVLYPLQQIKKRITEAASVPRIAYEQHQQAEAALEKAVEVLDDLRPRAEGEPLAPPRPVRNVRPAHLAQKPYLENAADVEEFLTQLRAELLAALADNGRIRLQ